MSYPLYRNWKLSNKIVEDVKKIFLGGKKFILKSLLKIKWIFERSEKRYLLTIIYINDYCVWIQKQDPKKIYSIFEHLNKLEIKKDNPFFSSFFLNQLESVAKENESEIRNALY